MHRVLNHLRQKKILMISDDGTKQQSFGFRVGCVVSSPNAMLPFVDALKLADAEQEKTRNEEDR